MSQRRGIITDQLINVIQVIQLGKKTGRLTVERGEGAQHENGLLVFTRGQITDAICGQMQGPTALDWLRTWGLCRFVFEAVGGERANGPLMQLSPQDTGPHAALRPNGSASQPSGPLPAISAQNDKIDNRRSSDISAFRVAPAPPGTPYRTKPDEVGMHLLTQARLSRQHLRLYLLIDGRRQTLELVRLMGRPSEEVLQLLYDLRSLGVIQY